MFLMALLRRVSGRGSTVRRAGTVTSPRRTSYAPPLRALLKRDASFVPDMREDPEQPGPPSPPITPRDMGMRVTKAKPSLHGEYEPAAPP